MYLMWRQMMFVVFHIYNSSVTFLWTESIKCAWCNYPMSLFHLSLKYSIMSVCYRTYTTKHKKNTAVTKTPPSSRKLSAELYHGLAWSWSFSVSSSWTAPVTPALLLHLSPPPHHPDSPPASAPPPNWGADINVTVLLILQFLCK